VDKLDKLPWDVVRNEMINEKGLSPDVADKIWSYVQMHGIFSFMLIRFYSFIQGNADLINQLRNDAQLSSQKIATEALNDLELLFRYLTLFNVTDKV
jgi:histidyl-tRNA synthetase